MQNKIQSPSINQTELNMICNYREYVQLLEPAKAVSRRMAEDILHTCCIARYAYKFRFALAAGRQSLLGGSAAA
jgi:hypothetical protein